MLAKNHLNSTLLINIFQTLCAQCYHNFGSTALKYGSLACLCGIHGQNKNVQRDIPKSCALSKEE